MWQFVLPEKGFCSDAMRCDAMRYMMNGSTRLTHGCSGEKLWASKVVENSIGGECQEEEATCPIAWPRLERYRKGFSGKLDSKAPSFTDLLRLAASAVTHIVLSTCLLGFLL